MADLHQVQINETNEEENISLEKQAAMQEEAAQERGQTLEQPTEEQPTEEQQSAEGEEQQQPTEERPEWLDEKFETPEDLAKAYNELQKKQSTKEPKESEETSSTQDFISQAQIEFSEKGELSDETFKTLEDIGIPREVVERHVEGGQAMADQFYRAVKETVGGSDNYEAMAEWAGENLPESELDAFNSIVQGNSLEQSQIAVKGLYAQFQAAGGGKAPNLVQGSTSGDGGVQPFTSTAQVTKAMKDPRYAEDPAYRAQVERRMAASNIF